MKYLSKALLHGLFADAETNISKAISEWQQIPSAVFKAQTGPGTWSAIQCLEHLNSYGRYYLPAIEKGMADYKKQSFSIYFKSGLLGNYFYKLMLSDSRGAVIKKMKSPKAHQPAPELNTPQVLSEFISQLEKLEQLITLAQKKDLNKIKIPISIAPFIKLKLGDVLLFYTAHLQRHLNQAERSLQAAGYKTDAGKIMHGQLKKEVIEL